MTVETKAKIVEMAFREYHFSNPGRPSITVKKIAQELTIDGWIVDSGSSFIGSSGREVGAASLRSSNGHERNGTYLFAQKNDEEIQINSRTINKVHQLCEQICKVYGWTYK